MSHSDDGVEGGMCGMAVILTPQGLSLLVKNILKIG